MGRWSERLPEHPDPVLAVWGTLLNMNPPTKSVTAAYSADGRDEWILADATGGAFSVTLPRADLHKGKEILVTRVNGGGNAVTVAAGSGDTLQGSGSLGSQGSTRTFRSDGGTIWYLIASV
jgi:hypothetical protein